MISLRSLSFIFLSYFLFINSSFSQEVFSCGGTGGFYSVILINPSAVDGDDGNLDGNCEYIFNTSIFSSFNTVVFTYVGTGTATPISVTHIRVPITPGTITVLAPCGNLDIDFDIAETNGNPICAIRNNLMPVELISFEAKVTKKGMQLNWATASEINNLGFDVERSPNGKTWKKVDFVVGNSTTLTTQYYEFMDIHPYEGQSYYRLKQMDFDGEYEYSQIVTANYKLDEIKFDIFPNPVAEVITFSLSEDLKYENVKVSIFNNLGSLVKQEAISSNKFIISDLPSGTYFLIAEIAQARHVARFVKK